MPIPSECCDSLHSESMGRGRLHDTPLTPSKPELLDHATHSGANWGSDHPLHRFIHDGLRLNDRPST